jgi:hypothetical protein
MLLMPRIQRQTLFFRLVISEVRLDNVDCSGGRGRRAADRLAVGGWGHLLAHHLRQSVRGSHDNADGPNLYRARGHPDFHDGREHHLDDDRHFPERQRKQLFGADTHPPMRGNLRIFRV